MNARETLGSRLGFILLSVGCAVGLGNVWRFPYMTGKYGGAMFVILYLIFLIALGFPLLVAELAIGRGGGSGLIGSVRRLSGGKAGFIIPAKLAFTGNLILMCYYSVVSGWLLAYSYYYFNGSIMKSGNTDLLFSSLTGNPVESTMFMLGCVLISTSVCSCGLRNGVERSVKWMMTALFLLITILAVRALLMPGAAEGVKFYLMPNWGSFSSNLGETMFAAMGQAFFTLSIGVGSMAIFGSYIGRERSLAGEGATIISLDTLIAILAGLIIFPICFSYDVDAGSGPGLIFISLPKIFSHMTGGRWWGGMFFTFLTLAALTTMIAVFENLIALLIDEFKFSRRTGAVIVGAVVGLLSLPCVFGFNIWSSFQPFGNGSCVLDLEDFIVSSNLLPLGALVLALLCSWDFGWGWKSFIAEANAGKGVKFPAWLLIYFRYILPLLVLTVLGIGYYQLFCR